jgi:ABC-2 type transport system ATP-binding protein
MSQMRHMPEPYALEAHGVSKLFGDREVLTAVDLVARPGEVHGLLGPNGAGKTTLMRVMLGLVRRDRGSVKLLGHTRDLGMTEPLPSGVAALVDTQGFYPYLSGRRNLALLARLDAAEEDAFGARVDRAIEMAGVAHADRAVGTYSAGMRQRLGLAAALLRSPRLLLLDEPTSSLDPRGAREVRALLSTLAHDGVAIVMSSHDFAEVEALCSMLTVVDRGRVLYSGTVEELRRRAPAPLHALTTSDNTRAVALASRQDLRVKVLDDARLQIAARLEALDAYVISLGQAGIAVRALERRARSVESLFLTLTNDRHTPESNARPGFSENPQAAS